MDRSSETVAVATICAKKMIISDGGREECETVRKGKCARRKLVAHALHGNFDVKNEMCNKLPLSSSAMAV